MKKRGGDAGVLSIPPPGFIKPCLPKLVDRTPNGESWVHEIKHDGYRLAVRVADGNVQLLTRRGLDWTSRFPLVHQAAQLLAASSAYIDGEVVIEGDNGVSDWVTLHACASAGRCPHATLWAFDLLFLNGRDLRRIPLIERKQMLADLIGPQPAGIHYVEYLQGNGPTIFTHACALGLEGVVSKCLDSQYRSGNTVTWVKSKCEQRGQFIIAGFIPNSANGRAVGALVLAEKAGDDDLKLAGRVGTGWTTKTAVELVDALQMIEQSAPPLTLPKQSYRNVRWVQPLVSVDVAFRGRTGEGLLRHPSYKKIVHVDRARRRPRP